MGRKILYVLGFVVIGLGAAWIFGPRTPVDLEITFDPTSIGPDLDAYLAEEEADISGIRKGLEKEIVWAFPASKAKTPLSIVYIHGFSASKGEVRPLPDIIAKSLGANLFYTRLAGHGRDGAAMADATVNAWLNNYAEAIAIGEALGERVIVMGTSTGGGLITWGLLQPSLTQKISGAVLISANYGIQAAGSEILTMPFAKTLANLIAGKERSFEPVNELHAKFWTHTYPTDAVLPMAALTALAANEPVEQIKTPALFIYSPTDKVIKPDLIEDIEARWGAPAEIYALPANDDPYSHVIAGDALSPSTTQPLADRVIEWVKTL